MNGPVVTEYWLEKLPQGYPPDCRSKKGAKSGRLAKSAAWFATSNLRGPDLRSGKAAVDGSVTTEAKEFGVNLMVVLVAENDVGVQFLIWKLLKGAGLTVLTARTGEAALEASHNYTGPIDLLLSEIEMPQMDGLELWRIISKERPGIKVLLMSAEPQCKQQLSMSQLPFLQKPFTLTSLQDSIESLLGPISALQ